MTFNKKPNIVFFGSSVFSVFVLEALKTKGFLPNLIVTTPSKPKGRKLIVTPSEVKVWADKNLVKTFDFANLRVDDVQKQISDLAPLGWDLFIVASYGKILPKNIIDLPKYGTLNVHPSLLPKLRGPAPIEYTILNDSSNTGVTIMKIDEEVDHGPIIAQKEIQIAHWPIDRMNLEEILGKAGGNLLSEIIEPWLNNEITPKEQSHAEATFSKKISKEDSLISLDDEPRTNLLKIKAYAGSVRCFILEQSSSGGKKRVVIVDAKLKHDGSLEILKVIPEGKKEMSWNDYLIGKKNMSAI